ncbi:MAG: YkgJ family cysteine cluster protein [Deltaproteobacteria bacterium]|nr:YkgJ family cysteine cluster protein [Deltaproteobacteria bacterium]MBW2041135.1 YkgJ family cysteine cluster protein [Deltaproteobacteria bacterium]MBW2131919.1 YkgJ family cysteine cluster protein [Deltaproteobacteria bacterium]
MTKTAEMKKNPGGLTVLGPQDIFRFECRPERACFTRCCRDITIFLTPYDIIRMKNALGISSEKFLADYTVAMIGDAGFPVVALKMAVDETKRCPFVTRNGCTIYTHRPWACRIYPLQPESTKITEKAGKAYYSVMDVPFCRGFDADIDRTVSEWIDSQGISQYLEMETLFKNITNNPRLLREKITNRQIQDMYYMACYDSDRFRRFVLESTFLDRFDVTPEVVAALKTDDVALHRFALQWLEYGLLAQQALKVKPNVLAAKKRELGIE